MLKDFIDSEVGETETVCGMDAFEGLLYDVCSVCNNMY